MVGRAPTSPSTATLDAFVAKVAPDGASLVYAGFIGGSGTDAGPGIAVDAAGAAYVTGCTDSTDGQLPGGRWAPT